MEAICCRLMAGRQLVCNTLRLMNQVRFAGHSKWQNIKSTKQAQDMYKSKLFSRYTNLARRAVVLNNLQTDPKLNKALADVLAEATKNNVPKTTMDKAIQRAANVKIEQKFIELVGPGGCVIILRCETDNYGLLRREVKKKIKKFPNVQIIAENKMIQLFHEKGYIKIEDKTSDGQPIDDDAAEEAAIMANAEEVACVEEIENPEKEDSALVKRWLFTTEQDKVNHCKVYLEKLNFNVVSSYTELVPYRRIGINEKNYNETEEVVESLRELPEVIDTYHNVTISS